MFLRPVTRLVAIVGFVLTHAALLGPAYSEHGGPHPMIEAAEPELTMGDTQYIYGQQFNDYAQVIVEVIRVDGSIVTGDGTETPGSDTVTVSGTGTFTYAYWLEGGTPAQYNGTLTVNAKDPSTGSILATTTFLDNTQFSLQGCSRDKGTCTLDNPVTGWAGGSPPMQGWTSGNLKGWYEGEDVPYRLRMTLRDGGAAGQGPHFIMNEHDNLRSGVLGVDSASQFYVGAAPGNPTVTEGTLTKNCTFQAFRNVGSNPTTGTPCIVTGPTYSGIDDDGDSLVDEDPVDGVDNDGDGKVDEDPPTGGGGSIKQIQYAWAVLFNASEVGNNNKKWALYWLAHLGPNSSTWPGASLHAKTSASGNQDVPINNVLAVAPGADLSISKLGSPGSVAAGGTLTYTITVTNNGPSTANDVTVSDTLPANVTYISATSTVGSCSFSSGTVTCNLNNMANGASATITITVSPLAAAVGTISNTAIVSSSTADPTPGNNSATTTTTVTASADLGITKVASASTVLVGGTLTYTITVTNYGPSTATGVQVTDTLPATVTLNSATSSPGSCTGTTTVVCTIGTLANGASGVVTITVTANSAGTISNSASVSSTTSDPNSSNNTAGPVNTTVNNPSADLSITKTDSPDPVTVGQNLTYTITVTNNGPNSASGVTMTDTLPAGVTFVSVTPGSPTCTNSSGTVTCNLGTLAASSSTTVTIVVTPTAAGTITNSASVTSSTSDPNTGNNNTGPVTTTVSPQSADLSITKTDSPDPVTVGNNVTYTITVTNNGPGSASGVTMTDTLPAGVTFVSVTPGSPTCTNSSGTVTCNLGTLAASASTTVTIVVTPTAAGTITNSASVTSSTSDPNTGNNSTGPVTTTVNPSANLSMTKTDSPDPVTVGQNITYTLTAYNAGPSSATGVTVIDTLPAGVTFVSVSPGSPTCTQSAGTVTCNFGTLAQFASASATVVVTANTAGTISNTASVTSSTPDPNTANNSATTSTTVNGSANLSIVKTDSPDPVVAGGTLTYSITVSNAGPSAANNVQMTDPLPAGVTLVSITPNGATCSGTSTITCNLGTMASGASTTITVVVSPSSAGTLTNTATVTSSTSDPNTSNNSSTATTTVNPAASVTDLQVTQSVSPNPVDVGLQATFTITVTNNGPDTATGVSLSNTLPTNVTFNSVNTSQGTCGTPSGGVFTCSLGTILNGGTVTITLVVTTQQAGMIQNSVSVSGNESESTTTNNSAATTANVGDVSRLVNISTRAYTSTGNNVMIGGFFVGGNLPKQLLVRARGPSLAGAPFFNAGTMANPTMQLFSGSTVVAQNDNWQTFDTTCVSPCVSVAQVNSTSVPGYTPCDPNPGQTSAPPGCTQEAALLVTLPPGGYTAIVSGVGGTSGVALVEVFDLDTGTLPKLVNISTRALVLTGDSVMIGGFWIGGGTGPKTILLRARGPSLGAPPFNNPGVLANPTFQLFSGSTVIAQNNDWQTTNPLCLSPAVSCGGVPEITATGLDPCQPNPGQTGPPPNCGLESAMYITLAPGGYTVIVSGVSGGTGMGLVEIFEVSP